MKIRGIGLPLLGVVLLTLIPMISVQSVYAIGNKDLGNMNAGVALILDALDRGSTAPLPENIITSVSNAYDNQQEDAKNKLVMVNVHNQLNVREEPSEDAKKIGLMYADCGGEILEQEGNWTKLKSGNLVGWASNDYLLFGDEADALAREVGITTATVRADALRVRKEPDTDSGIWGLVKKGDEIEAITADTTDEWVAIDFSGEEGYISAEYVDISFTIDAGETLEEKAEREAMEDFELLSALVYLEAGNQGYDGMLAVAAVVMNRVKSSAYPNTVSGVIYASGQFAPARGGRLEAQIEIGVPKACRDAASEALRGKSNIGSATHFRRYSGQAGTVIGAHVFY